MGQLDGHCLCGNISYTCSEEPVTTFLCHCTDCQRGSGSAFSVVIGVDLDALTVTGDTLGSYTTVGEDTKQEVVRQFCTNCGSPLISLPEATPDMAFIKGGTLNDHSWLEPEMELWARSAHPYVPHDEENRGVFERSVPFD
ncbi:MAG TPA: GFA family protein [Solirubrobacteraceae bacterium]|nr:GFA family protein [Solirubrobacteraceae bacterium]